MTMGLNEKIEARRRALEPVESEHRVVEDIADLPIKQEAHTLSLAEKVAARRQELEDMARKSAMELQRREEETRPRKEPHIPLSEAIELLSTRDAIWIGIYIACGILIVLSTFHNDFVVGGLFLGVMSLVRVWMIISNSTERVRRNLNIEIADGSMRQGRDVEKSSAEG